MAYHKKSAPKLVEIWKEQYLSGIINLVLMFQASANKRLLFLYVAHETIMITTGAGVKINFYNSPHRQWILLAGLEKNFMNALKH
jgi:hypothetical protein